MYLIDFMNLLSNINTNYVQRLGKTVHQLKKAFRKLGFTCYHFFFFFRMPAILKGNVEYEYWYFLKCPRKNIQF